MFELKAQTPLPSLCGERYRGIAYDGCYFYLPVRGQCRILQLSPCLERVQCFETRRPYTALCYDWREHCFWAAGPCQSTLYKLDQCLGEIDSISLRSPDGCPGVVTGVSYECCEQKLLVSFADGVLRVNPHCPEEADWVVKTQGEWFLGVVSVCPYFLCHCMEDGRAFIRVYSHCGLLLDKAPLPWDFGLESAVFWPCAESFCPCRFCVLCTKHGAYPYVCEYVFACSAVCGDICPCNFELCHCPPCPQPCDDACSAVLESIALMEAALAHILNAEGEKIQRAVASGADACKLLEVNESVNKTLSKAVYLEQLLCCKLESLGQCCDLCTPEQPGE